MEVGAWLRALEAEACFHRAAAVARGQGARLRELRATACLARPWRDRAEKRREAHDLLAPLCGRFA